MMARFDDNGDGKLDLEEFQRWSNTIPIYRYVGDNFQKSSFCKPINATNEIFMDFSTVDMFSKYVWHVHNVDVDVVCPFLLL